MSRSAETEAPRPPQAGDFEISGPISLKKSAFCAEIARAVAVLALLLPGSLSAQEKLPTLDDVRDGVQGTEVYLQGYLGTGLVPGDDDAFSFVTPDRIAYDVVFDAGREARKALQGCRLETFTGGTPCRIAGYGELEWDGPRLRVILYSIETQEAPAPMDRKP